MFGIQSQHDHNSAVGLVILRFQEIIYVMYTNALLAFKSYVEFSSNVLS